MPLLQPTPTQELGDSAGGALRSAVAHEHRAQSYWIRGAITGCKVERSREYLIQSVAYWLAASVAPRPHEYSRVRQLWAMRSKRAVTMLW